MSARRRRRRMSSTGADKFRNKHWLKVQVPDYIGEESLGQTLTTELETVIGRTIKTSMMELTNDFSDLNYYLTFKITKLVGNRAITEFYGQELSRDYRRSQIRNHRSQVDGIFNLILADGARVRVTTFVVTPIRAAHNTKKAVRAAVKDKIEEMTADMTFPAFVNKLISYELRDELLPAAQEEFPIKLLEIAKVKVMRLPEDRRMMDLADIVKPEGTLTADDEEEEEEVAVEEKPKETKEEVEETKEEVEETE